MTNSASGEFSGPVVQVGVVRGDVTIGSAGPVRSRYLAQVERIAPPELMDRGAELAELARFCTSPATEGRYVWWRAEPWAGKSALLSTFVLYPPPGVRMVSFFVTASLGRHSDRQAFVDNLLEQLCALLGQPPLGHATESTRETHALGMLRDAARWCRDRGEQFVLVVDGLGEDRGIDGTPDAHSIAALLPADPPMGMRVIVSGRPSPPIPDDVADHHPLRDPAIVRTLAPSEHAQAERHTMERDLKRLLHGTPLEQDLLGLLTAAGDGLTTQDLAQLIGVSEWQLDDLLRSAAGRSFARRASEQPGHTPDVHSFAHEQLHVAAHTMVGQRLGGYRERLHKWADTYADRHWPSDTPEYLFRGYFTMVTATQDVSRMIACATDPYRQRRALARTGGDGVALAEITTTEKLILNEPEPDLVSLARLAVHRTHLYQINSSIPATLPAGWARVGQFDRAEAMINAIRDPVDRIDALLATTRLCRALEEPGRAEDLLNQAVEHAMALNQFWSARPIRSVAEELTRVGEHDRAAHLTNEIRDETARAEALAWLAHRAAGNDMERAHQYLANAEELMRSNDNSWRHRALAAMAVAATSIGEPAKATAFLDEAEALSLSDTIGSPVYLGLDARCAALAGDDDRAVRFAMMIDDEVGRERWLRDVLRHTARHDSNRAEAMARATTEASLLCPRLALLAQAIHRKDSDRAASLTAEADGIAQQISDHEKRQDALMAVAIALANSGDTHRAAAIAHDYAETGTDGQLVLDVARAVLRADDLERGIELLILAEAVARKGVDRRDEPRSVLWIRIMADFQDFDRAIRLATSFENPTIRSAAWSAIAEGALAADAFELAEQAVAAIDEAAFQRRPRLELVRALSTTESAHAVTIARGAQDPTHRAAALLLVAQVTHSAALFDEVQQIADTVPESNQRMSIQLRAVELAAAMRLREPTTRLLANLRKTAQTILDNEPSKHDLTLRYIMQLCTNRIRTFTETTEAAANLQKWSPFSSTDLFREIIPQNYFPPKVTTSELAPEKTLAHELTTTDWREVVEELVAQSPQTYSAIIAELDKIEDVNK